MGYLEASTFNLVYEVSGHPGDFPSPGSYVQHTGVYNTGSAGTEIGKAITVRLLNGSDFGGWDPYWFDDILLTPEPTTMLLLLAGGLAALLRRRR